MRNILNPKAVAVVGATEKADSVGRTILENLLMSEDRKIFAVNPNRKEVLGLPCYATISDIPERVNLAVVVTPAPTVPDIVESCAQKGVDGAIIISEGFKEAGGENGPLEERLIDIRKKYGMRIIGPNCLGIIMPNMGLNASFLKTNLPKGNIAFISQSVSLASAQLEWAMNTQTGFSMFASLGSTIDVDFGDLIDYLKDDDDTKSIMLYMKDIGNARKFMSAARGYVRSKPIIVVKPNRFPKTRRDALSRTGEMVNIDEIYEAAFKRAGVVRVREIVDLINAAEVLDSRRLPRGTRLAIVSNAEGLGAMGADALLEQGAELAPFSEETLKKLDSLLPPGCSRVNPLNILGDADVERYMNVLNVCLNDREVDGILVIYAPVGSTGPAELATAVITIAKRSKKPILTAFVGTKVVEEARLIFFHNSIPTYRTPEEAVKTYLYMYRYKKNLDLLYETPAELPLDQTPTRHNLKALIRRVIRSGRFLLNEEESKNFLINYGIPVTTPYISCDVEAAKKVAHKIGYPVVMKIVSPDISHKSDVGGVAVGIDSDEALTKTYSHLMERVKGSVPEASIQGITIQRMIEKIDYETILGAKKDKDFGSVILFGKGGVGAQIYRDFSIGLPPLNQTLARRLMEETQIYKVLQGYRHKMPADLAHLEQIIVSFSNLIVDFPEIAEMDINPLVVSEGRFYALNARIVLDGEYTEQTPRYPHLIITPYPTRYILPRRLPDGTEILLRPIKPEDEPLEHEFLATLSKDTLRRRFFSVPKNITHDMLITFCNIDYDREMAIVAEMKEGERKKLVGIGRLVIEPGFRAGEFAVLVHDSFHGRGLGYKLADELIGIGEERGLQEIYGTVQSDNERMLRVCRRLGFTTRALPDGTTRVTLHLR